MDNHSRILGWLHITEQILNPPLILQKCLAESFKTRQYHLWTCDHIAFLFNASASSEAITSLFLFSRFIHFSLHEHHPRSLPSECLARIEASALTAAGAWCLVVGALLEERNFSLLQGRERWWIVRHANGLRVLKGFFVVIAINREQLVEPVPLLDRWICLF